jgi:hypothetical protein
MTKVIEGIVITYRGWTIVDLTHAASEPLIIASVPHRKQWTETQRARHSFISGASHQEVRRKIRAHRARWGW